MEAVNGARDHLRYLGPSHAGMSKPLVIENEVRPGDGREEMNIMDTLTKRPASPDLICFGPFRLSVTERLLEKDGVPVRLGSRALDILIAFVERPGEVVSKKDLFARVWPDLAVDESNLRYHVSALRKALGERQSGTCYVTNVSGRGYCFVAPISHAAPGLREGSTM
jgi:DNA-binding winged helix-turn-helix (wHTH) protein